jgi:hypothetical protein
MPKRTKPSSRPKTLYRVKNWSEYEKALVQRGSITFWLSDDLEKVWMYAGETQRGSQFEYSDKAIPSTVPGANCIWAPILTRVKSKWPF